MKLLARQSTTTRKTTAGQRDHKTSHPSITPSRSVWIRIKMPCDPTMTGFSGSCRQLAVSASRWAALARLIHSATNLSMFPTAEVGVVWCAGKGWVDSAPRQASRSRIELVPHAKSLRYPALRCPLIAGLLSLGCRYLLA